MYNTKPLTGQGISCRTSGSLPHIPHIRVKRCKSNVVGFLYIGNPKTLSSDCCHRGKFHQIVQPFDWLLNSVKIGFDSHFLFIFAE